MSYMQQGADLFEKDYHHWARESMTRRDYIATYGDNDSRIWTNSRPTSCKAWQRKRATRSTMHYDVTYARAAESTARGWPTPPRRQVCFTRSRHLHPDGSRK